MLASNESKSAGTGVPLPPCNSPRCTPAHAVTHPTTNPRAPGISNRVPLVSAFTRIPAYLSASLPSTCPALPNPLSFHPLHPSTPFFYLSTLSSDTLSLIRLANSTNFTALRFVSSLSLLGRAIPFANNGKSIFVVQPLRRCSSTEFVLQTF